MKRANLPAPDELRKLLRYEPDTGKLYWLQRPGDDRDARWFNTRYAGKEAFTCVGSNGYPKGGVNYVVIEAHRVIWALVHGEWPEGQIDHIDGDRRNNRLDNLRLATPATNARNQRRRAPGFRSVMGLRWHRSSKRWRVVLGSVHVGSFVSREEALAARTAALAKLGYDPDHGTDGGAHG